MSSPSLEVLTASLNIKIAAVLLALMLLLVTVGPVTDPAVGVAVQSIFGVAGVGGALLCVRWARSRVVVTDTEILVIGILRSRRFPKSSVTGVNIEARGILWLTPELKVQGGKNLVIGFLCDLPQRPGKATRLKRLVERDVAANSASG